MAWFREWRFTAICIHIEAFNSLFFFFFPSEPLDYIVIITRQILLIKVEANFLGLSLKMS